jgi:hypothetical protein
MSDATTDSLIWGVLQQLLHPLLLRRPHAHQGDPVARQIASTRIVGGGTKWSSCVLHPFEDRGLDSCAQRVRRVREARPDALLTTAFELVRRPGHVVGHLLTA